MPCNPLYLSKIVLHSSRSMFFRVSANKFFQYDFATFTSIYLMEPATAAPSSNTKSFNSTPPVGATTVNWVTAGYVTAVKDQGQCGKKDIFADHLRFAILIMMFYV